MKLNNRLALLLALLLSAVFLVSTASAAPKPDPANLHLASVNALVVDLDNNQTLYASNINNQVPIASITKLMTALVVVEAGLPMTELIPVQVNDVKEMKNVFSRLRIGSVLPRREMLKLAVMSSENRAAASLAHSYPGGVLAFRVAMNKKALELGMHSSHFADPTGLSEKNVSTAADLVKLLVAANKHKLIRELTTSSKSDARFRKPGYTLAFYNTNPLVNKDSWSIMLSKTGYIDEAGRCLVMVTELAKRKVAVVLLDSFGKRSPVGDAIRIRRWLETGKSGTVPNAARRYQQDKLAQLKTASNTQHKIKG